MQSWIGQCNFILSRFISKCKRIRMFNFLCLKLKIFRSKTFQIELLVCCNAKCMQMYTFNYALILALCVEPQNLNPTYREDSRLEFFNVPLSHKIDSDPQNWGHKDYTKYLTKYYFNGVLMLMWFVLFP